MCKDARGKPSLNWASNWRCGNCRVAKGKCHATNAEENRKGRSPTWSQAEWGGAHTASLAEIRDQNKKLEEQVKRLEEKSHKEVTPVAKENPQEIKNINEEIRDIEKKKKAFKAVDASIRDDCGWASQNDKLAERKEELLAFKQGLRPPDERKQAASEYAKKCKKWLDDANVATGKLDADMAEIQKKKIQHLEYVASCGIKLNKANLLVSKVAEEIAEIAKEKAKNEGQQQEHDRAFEAISDAKRVDEEKKRVLAKMLAEAKPETLRELGIDATVVENVKKQIVEPPQKDDCTKTPTFSMASENGDSTKDEQNDTEDDEPRAKKVQRTDRAWSPTSPLVLSPASPAPGEQSGSPPTSPAPQRPGLDEPMGENEGEVDNLDEDSIAAIIEQTWQTTMEVHKKDNDEDTHSTWVENKEEWIAKHKEKLRTNEKNGSGYAPY